MLENGSDACNCRKKKCVRHGNCAECMNFHNNSLRHPEPYCKRHKTNKRGKEDEKSTTCH